MDDSEQGVGFMNFTAKVNNSKVFCLLIIAISGQSLHVLQKSIKVYFPWMNLMTQLIHHPCAS